MCSSLATQTLASGSYREAEAEGLLDGWRTLCKLIQTLPVALHGALISSMINGRGKHSSLSILVPRISRLLAAGIGISQVGDRSLHSLRVEWKEAVGNNISILVHSTVSHTSLTHLSIESPLKESEVFVLRQSLPDISRLGELDLKSTFRGPSLAAFSNALHQLPSLLMLSVESVEADEVEVCPGSAAQAACHSFVQVCTYLRTTVHR